MREYIVTFMNQTFRKKGKSRDAVRVELYRQYRNAGWLEGFVEFCRECRVTTAVKQMDLFDG